MSSITPGQVSQPQKTSDFTNVKKPKELNGAYAFILIFFGYSLSKAGGILEIIGQIMGILGLGFLIGWLWKKSKICFLWLQRKFKKQ